jgi:hypothetical protein
LQHFKTDICYEGKAKRINDAMRSFSSFSSPITFTRFYFDFKHLMTSKLLQSIDLKSAIVASGNNPIHRISSFADILSKLSGNPDKYEALRKLAENLDSEDVNSLRSLIFDEVSKLKYLNSIEVTEQILFLIIGALKLDAKQDSFTDPWYLANLSIKSLIKKNNNFYSYKYAFLSLIFLSIGALLWFAGTKYNSDIIPASSTPHFNELIPLPEPVLNPYIPSHFYSLKAQMDNTTCQFPQAAMLPADQRAAFLNFINTGKIALEELSNLQKALTRVNCDYTPLTSRLIPVNE